MRLALLVVLGSLTARADVFLFGDASAGWHLVNENGERLRTLTTIAGVAPADATVSRDGKRWAVVTSPASPSERRSLLLASRPDGKSERSITSKGNVLDGVAFSHDGAWVYFSANDDAQPTFANEPMKYAQIYRAEFTSGRVERLTLEAGCHMWPRPTASGAVVNSHATCRGGRSLEVRTGTRNIATLVPNTTTVGEAAPSADGKTIFYVQPTARGDELLVVSVRDGVTSKWGDTVRCEPVDERLISVVNA